MKGKENKCKDYGVTYNICAVQRVWHTDIGVKKDSTLGHRRVKEKTVHYISLGYWNTRDLQLQIIIYQEERSFH